MQTRTTEVLIIDGQERIVTTVREAGMETTQILSDDGTVLSEVSSSARTGISSSGSINTWLAYRNASRKNNVKKAHAIMGDPSSSGEAREFAEITLAESARMDAFEKIMDACRDVDGTPILGWWQ